MKLVELGRIGRPHGLRGEVRLHPHQGDGGILFELSEVIVQAPDDAEPSTVRIEGMRRSGKVVLVKIEGVDDRDAADQYRGAAVSVPRTLLPDPAAGEFYLCDLVGCSVVGPDEEPVGEVVEVRIHPTVDTMVIRQPDGEVREHPIAEHWLDLVDLDGAKVVLASLDGLI